MQTTQERGGIDGFTLGIYVSTLVRLPFATVSSRLRAYTANFRERTFNA